MRFNSYFICTSPRSGSTLLCGLLRNAGDLGVPESHFHEPSLEKWLGYYGLNRRDYEAESAALRAVFKSAIDRGKGASDLFGLRLQRHSFDYFARQLAVLHPAEGTDHARIHAAFGKTLFIHLTRENKLDQAISYVIAQQSGLWHIAPDGSEVERLSDPQKPNYDRAAIAAQLALFQQMDTDWAAWFASQGITPLRVTYDELSANPKATVKRVSQALGIAIDQIGDRPPPVAKLADETNRIWAARFRSEAG